MLQKIKSSKAAAFTRKAAASAVLAGLSIGTAFAQTTGDDPTTDLGVQAIQGLKTTATVYIGAAFAVAVLVAGGFWGIAMMKKSFGAAK